MSHFKEALAVCGLSPTDASVFLGLSKSTVDSMASGRRPVSDLTWRKLSDLWQKINLAARDAKAALENASDQKVDPRAEMHITSSRDLPPPSNRAAAAIAILELTASLPREDDRAENSDEKPLLMPAKDVKIPDTVGGRIGRVLLRGRWYEQEMLDYIRTLRLGGNYLDVGANIGNHSLYFAVNTDAERIFSFEPTRRARGILNKFVEINDLWEKISAIPYACSDTNGEIEVVETLASDKAPLKYPCRKIDDLINSPISLVKMDIEGAEPYALRGAVRVLAESKPVMFIEVHDDKHMNEIMSIIGPLGYRTTGNVWNPSPTYEFVAV